MMRVMIQLVRQIRTVGLAMAVLAAFGLAAPYASAQQAGSASLQGMVFDSTRMEVLPGARVAVMGTTVTGSTDEAGRFSLDGVPPGQYWVSFYHDRLQTLGVSPQSRQVEFSAGQRVQLELAIPSEKTLLMGWCLAEQSSPESAVVAGVVTDSLTGVPMPRAIVTAQPTGRYSGVPPVEARTDDSGYFRMCSVRADVDIRLQAHFGQSSGRSVDVRLQPGTAQIQDLALLMSSEGTLAGYVRDYQSGDPVSGATVAVMGTTSSTLTDGTGRFILDDLPPGRHLVTTDHIAFQERTDSVTIFSQETVDIEVNMATEALEVEGLVVTARTRFGRTSLAGDAKRIDFLGREEIEALLPRVTATPDLLRNMNAPGLRIREVYQTDELTGVMVPGICIEIRRSGGEGCRPAAVAINNVIVPYPDEVLRDLDPTIIDRIEILSPIDAQFQFGSVAGNGAVVIFTR
ncbi:MAG: carboxypeptidase regulatory-like domain-containing protein [Gemmatimonadetes bacterium]|nr:carboxypeptidase regulatory-like domain-containing protein [Gemmatimonadota bacterium]